MTMRANQEDADFRRFVDRFSPTLRRAAYLLLHDHYAAEDAMQASLLRTFVNWNRAQRAPEAYTQRVLVNVCRNHWRHERRHPVHARIPDDDVDETRIVGGNAAAEAGLTDQRLLLEDLLAELPAQQRAVLVLRFFFDRSVPDTAKLLRIPEGTVKSATHRGLAALRRGLPYGTQEVRSDHR